MNDRPICPPWDKKFVMTPLGQTVYGELRYKNLQENMEISPYSRRELKQDVFNTSLINRSLFADRAYKHH